MSAEIITTRGNDFFLRVNLFKKLDDGSSVPFDLTVCDNFKGAIKNEYSETSLAESIGIIEGTNNAIAIDCAGLSLGMCYVVEITGSLDGRNFRCAEKCVLGVTEYNANATVTEQTIEAGIGIDMNMTFQLLDSSAIVGKNAYELAVEDGYEGTLQDYLDEMVDAGQSAGAANNAAQAANTATTNANNATTNANNATTNANNAAQAANTATTNANNAAQAANNAAQAAQHALDNLSPVAFSGDYDDLSDKPVIPSDPQDIYAMPRKVFLGNPRENYFADDVYISVLDNALFAANRRFNVSCVITDTNGNIVSRNVSYDGLFNSNYDDSTVLMVAEGETAVLTIMGGSTFDETRFSDITYTSGYIYLHCYGQKFPSNVTGRLYSKNASTLGWHSFTFAPMENSSCILVAQIGNWPIPTALELTIEGANYIGQSPAMAAITEIEWDTKRHFTTFGVVSKGRSETLYFPFKVNNTVTVSQSVTAQSFIKSGGTNSQVLLASGSSRNINDFQANWNQATTTALDYIKNKPTNVSAFNNDRGYISSTTVTTIVTMTQAQYDALTIKDNNTIYNIIEE